MRYLILGYLLTACSVGFAPATDPDHARIHAVFAEYVSAWRDADRERLARVLDPAGSVSWVGGAAGASPSLQSMTFAKVLAREKKPQPQYGLDWRVLGLDVVDGKLAVGKLHISRAGGSYVDYLVLQKIGDEWRIVNKTFVSRST